MVLLAKAKDGAFWEKLRTLPAYSGCVEELKHVYAQSKTIPLPPLTRADRALFDATGSRKEFEAIYFRRRKFLTTAALLALLYPDKPHFLEETEMLLQATCDEFSWALPAHTSKLGEEQTKTFIDLFTAETGLAVTEICYLLKDKLNPRIRERAESEVKRRVIDSFLGNVFWWESDASNWAAVCAGNVCGTFLYLAPDLYSRIAPRIDKAIECFLSSYTDDGTCLEGFTYWHYGYGEFVWFADLLKQFTDGKKDYFCHPKAEAAAGYVLRSFLCGNTTVSFSDGVRNGKADISLISYLCAQYPRSFHPLPAEVTSYPAGNGDWLQLSRLCLYYDPALANGTLPQGDLFLPQAGQAIVHRKKYSLAVKAGHNGEPHNHNDTGSFILATERGQMLCDLGAGLYTKQYFGEKTRYEILCNSSLGHSVPIVNGAPQQAGKQFFGTIEKSDGTITVNFAGAYGQPSFSRLERKFVCDEERVTLTDRFMPNYESLVERFISIVPPVVENDCVRIGNVLLRFDRNKVMPAVSRKQHALHEAEDGKEKIPVYLLDFHLKSSLSSVTFAIEILTAAK